jgi:hypothetical protein
MQVLHGSQQLPRKRPHALLRQIPAPPAHQLVKVGVHQLEDEREAACRSIKKHVEQADDVSVRREAAERLHLAQRFGSGSALEARFHALDGDGAPRAHALSLEHLAEGALALFADQAVFF